MKADDALEVSSVDVAFDYCLSRISGFFMKRDVFLAISDFARSLWLLSAIGIFPLRPDGAVRLWHFNKAKDRP